MEEDPQEQQPLDVNAWVAKQEDREKGMGILAPRDKEEMDAREPYITVLRGIVPDLQLSVQAAYEKRMTDHMIDNAEYVRKNAVALIKGEKPPKKFDDEDLDVVPWITHHAASLKAFRSKQIEEMAKMSPKPPTRRSLFDLIRGH